MVFGIAFCLLVPCLIVSLLSFDRLVRFEYMEHRAAWRENGSPMGVLYWRPPRQDLRLLGSAGSGTMLSMVWLFTTPPWARQDPQARRLLRRMRLSALIWNLGVIAAASVQLLLFHG